MSCPICNLRKEKRFCPAVHGKICAQCCGEQREVTLDCPSECVYLQQARQHEKAADAAPIDRAAMFPEVEISEAFLYEHEQLILGLSYALVKSARAGRSLDLGSSLSSLDGKSLDARPMNDRDLIGALTSMAKSYQTLVESNLIYEQSTANLAHQQVAREVATMVKEFREAEVKHLGYSRLKDREVLLAIVFLLRMALARTSGRPKSRAYVDFLFAQFPPETQAGVGESAGSGLIIP